MDDELNLCEQPIEKQSSSNNNDTHQHMTASPNGLTEDNTYPNNDSFGANPFQSTAKE